MELLFDLFGFLSTVLRFAVLAGMALTLGGVAFLALLAHPLQPRLGAAGPEILRRSYRVAGWSALGFALATTLAVANQTAVLATSSDVSAALALTSDFAYASYVAAICALLVGLLAFGRGSVPAMVALAATILVAATFTSHGMGRVDGRAPMMLADGLHQLGAALWIGGLPSFVIAMGLTDGTTALASVGQRYSAISLAAVALLVAAGIALAVVYVGSWELAYGTAYGIMTLTKVGLLLGLLMLGALNLSVTRRLRVDPLTPALRLRRFAEAEIGIGLTVFCVAASLTSSPPAADQYADRASWAEIVERITPQTPRLASPEHDALAIPALQAKLDQEAAQEAAKDAAQPRAFVPGAGFFPPQNANDIAWSEYNHHWAGILVIAIGLLALLERTGKAPWARHWPLLFFVLAMFLLVRSDPEAWPLGDIGFWESLRDAEVLQHRLVVVLVSAFGLFEWAVRTGRLKRWSKAPLVFPLLTAIGACMLLLHSHTLSNVRQSFLIEFTHIPMALLGVASAWGRWLEIRLAGWREGRIAGWVWPACYVGIGLVLLDYRES